MDDAADPGPIEVGPIWREKQRLPMIIPLEPMTPRPAPPPYEPAWGIIACRGCGRRLYDDRGHEMPNPARWWQFWAWGC